MSGIRYFGDYHTCANCGERFWVQCTDLYVYKRKPYRRTLALFCGWNCMRAWDKKYADETHVNRLQGQAKRTDRKRKVMINHDN